MPDSLLASGPADRNPGAPRSVTGAMDPPPANPPRRGPAPALVTAGALSIGAALGQAVSAAQVGAPGAWGDTALVVLLGAAAIAWFRPHADGRRRSTRRAAVLLVALAALAGVRSWAGGTECPGGIGGAGGPGARLGAVHPHRHARDRTNRSWDMGDPTRAAAFECEEGLVRPGEVVHVLHGVDAPQRAASLHRPLVVRRLPLRPRADQVVRLGPRPGWAGGARASEPAGDGVLTRARRMGIQSCLDHPDPDTAGLLAALLFGDPSRLEPGIADLFTRTGTRHLLALSGFHVGLLGLLIAVPLARLLCSITAAALLLIGRPGHPSPALPTALIALAFVPLSGDGAPAARAAIALSLAVIGPVLGRRPSGLNLLGVALVLEIALDPHAPLRAGLQLSYLATLSLVIATPIVTRRVLARAPGGGVVSPSTRTGRLRPPLARALAEWSLRGVAIGAATSLIATAATLPIAWTRFGEFSPIGIVATPLATLPLIVLVGFGWIWLAASAWTAPALLGHEPALFGQEPAQFGQEIVGWATGVLLDGLALADRAPWSPLPLPERPVVALGVAATLAIVGAAHRTPRIARRSLRASAFLFAMLVAPWPGQRSAPAGPRTRAETLEVHVIDVGSGTAVIVRAPGSRTWVFDAGSRDRVGVSTDGVGPLLRSLDVGRISIALSHDHADHARDLPWVARRWPPDVWVGSDATARESPWYGPSPFEACRRPVAGRGRTRVDDADGGLTVLAIRGGSFGLNESSITLDMRWRAPGGRTWRVVLSGDAEDHGLAAAIAGDADGAWLEPGPVDVLLLPHHGSDSRHLGALLDHLAPQLALGSGAGPPIVGAELARRGIQMRTTGLDGAIQWRAGEGLIEAP